MQYNSCSWLRAAPSNYPLGVQVICKSLISRKYQQKTHFFILFLKTSISVKNQVLIQQFIRWYLLSLLPQIKQMFKGSFCYFVIKTLCIHILVYFWGKCLLSLGYKLIRNVWVVNEINVEKNKLTLLHCLACNACRHSKDL